MIVNSSAEMVVNRMINKKENIQNFSLEYIACSNDELTVMFLAYETAKTNYKEFEDMVSFDATYTRNM